MLDKTTTICKSFVVSSFIKRGMKTVRSRATEYIDTLRIKQIKELPLPEAQEQFSQILDVWDRATMKAYFGTQAHRQTWVNQRRKQYHTGTVSIANIELSHDVKTCKGYLEKLGLVHYEKRGKTYFMVLENCPIIPEIVKASIENEKSMRNFSLTSIPTHNAGQGAKPHTAEAAASDLLRRNVDIETIETEKRERVQSGRERNSSQKSFLTHICHNRSFYGENVNEPEIMAYFIKEAEKVD